MEAPGADSKKGGSGMEPKTVKVVRNSDNDALLPSGNEKVLIGCVDEVNGAGAVEVAEYVPTRHEIMQIVKYWHLRTLDNNWFFFIYGGTGSSEVRLKAFARRRIARADAAIGEEAVDAAIKEARDEFKTKINDDRLWTIFENGTEEQWKEVLEENALWELGQSAADALKLMEQLEKKHLDDSVALVLQGPPADKGRAVLISSATDPELLAVLPAGSGLEIETDRSKVRTMIVDQGFFSPGCLRIRRQEGSWVVVESASTLAGADGREFLGGVASRVRELLSGGTARKSRQY
jgi:hypothetical protein